MKWMKMWFLRKIFEPSIRHISEVMVRYIPSMKCLSFVE
jgi:hypothetical protein